MRLKKKIPPVPQELSGISVEKIVYYLNFTKKVFKMHLLVFIHGGCL